jgi:hypothetical protein
MSNAPSSPDRWTISDLNLSARITLAVFMISVGIGYVSALVNLHFQEASPGNLLPDQSDVNRAYRGHSEMSQFERLLLAHPVLPFNGQGQMREAFMKSKAGGIKSDMKRKAAELRLDPKDPKNEPTLEKAVLKDIDGERQALLAWLRAGRSKVPAEQAKFKPGYEEDKFKLEGDLKELAITPRFLEVENDVRFAKINSIIESRCVRCHKEGSSAGGGYALATFDDVTNYTSIEKPTGKSLSKLAMSSHVHLLGFAVLYGMTGLILALSRLPGWLDWIRLPLAPLALAAQVVDIAFWWLARMDEPYGGLFASAIPISGGVAAGALGLQIVLSLFSMFRLTGKAVLVILFALAIGGGLGLKQKIIDPFLAQEKESKRIVGKE